MEEQELKEFSWTNLFIVTGMCFLGFSWLLKLLDESHVQLFFRIGLLFTALGVLAYLNVWLSPKFYNKSNTTQANPSQQEQLF